MLQDRYDLNILNTYLSLDGGYAISFPMTQDGKIDLSELRYFFRTCGQTDVVAELWLHKSSKYFEVVPGRRHSDDFPRPEGHEKSW